MFILELLKLSNLKLSEFERNNYTSISPIQPPFVMTRGNTYGSTDSSPGDHQFSIGLWPVFFRQFLFYAFKKNNICGRFLKIVPVLCRIFKKKLKSREEKPTIQT